MWQPHWQTELAARFVRLGACIAVMASVWLGILPYVNRQPRIDDYIRRNELLGIDPSAKFYTELPAMPTLLERVRNRTQ